MLPFSLGNGQSATLNLTRNGNAFTGNVVVSAPAAGSLAATRATRATTRALGL